MARGRNERVVYFSETVFSRSSLLEQFRSALKHRGIEIAPCDRL